MILQISVLILSCCFSYVLVMSLPEIKKFLMKDHSNTYNIYNNNNNDNGNNSGFSRGQESEQQSEKEKQEDEEKQEKDVHEKLNSIFITPDVQDVKVHFDSLGKEKVTKHRREKNENKEDNNKK